MYLGFHPLAPSIMYILLIFGYTYSCDCQYTFLSAVLPHVGFGFLEPSPVIVSGAFVVTCLEKEVLRFVTAITHYTTVCYHSLLRIVHSFTCYTLLLLGVSQCIFSSLIPQCASSSLLMCQGAFTKLSGRVGFSH